MWLQIRAFLTLVLWDWVAVASTRYVVAQSDWSIPLAAVTTILWIYGVRFANQPKVRMVTITLGTIVGTWLGIRWP